MAVTITAQRQPSEAHVMVLRVAMDASYPTGGEEILSLIQAVSFDGVKPINSLLYVSPARPRSGADRIYHWDGATKLMAFVVSTAAQVADTTDLSADVVDLLVVYI